jgi:hypothetical protein
VIRSEEPTDVCISEVQVKVGHYNLEGRAKRNAGSGPQMELELDEGAWIDAHTWQRNKWMPFLGRHRPHLLH